MNKSAKITKKTVISINQVFCEAPEKCYATEELVGYRNQFKKF